MKIRYKLELNIPLLPDQIEAYKSGNTDFTNHIDHRTVAILANVISTSCLNHQKRGHLLDLHEFLEMRMLQLDGYFAPSSTIGRAVHLCELQEGGSALIFSGCQGNIPMLHRWVQDQSRRTGRPCSSPCPCATFRPASAAVSGNTGLAMGASTRSICDVENVLDRSALAEWPQPIALRSVGSRTLRSGTFRSLFLHRRLHAVTIAGPHVTMRFHARSRPRLSIYSPDFRPATSRQR